VADSIDALIENMRERALKAGKSAEEVDGIVGRIFREATDKSVPNVVEQLVRTMPEMLKEHRALERGFTRRLRNHWGEALDLMYVVVAGAIEMGEHFKAKNDSHADEWLLIALIGLYARACRVAMEVHHLLGGGLPLGALARSRTLHEIAVVTSLISKFDGRSGHDDLAERYMLHALILQHKDYLQYDRTFSGVPHEFEGPFVSSQKARDGLRERFGKEFLEPHGWAFNVTGNARAGIDVLEKMANLDHLRIFYKVTSHEVHADAAGWASNRVERGGVLYHLSGRTNIDFEIPAFLTLESLKQVVDGVLLSRYGSKSNHLVCGTFEELIHMTGDAFEKGGASVAAAEERFQEKQKRKGGRL
jgi:hypothetical protein